MPFALPAGVTRAKARLRDKGEPSEVEIREIRLPKGLLFPRLVREFIVQQTNCITCDVKGLAEAIREDRPWACPSKDRIPIKWVPLGAPEKLKAPLDPLLLGKVERVSQELSV